MGLSDVLLHCYELVNLPLNSQVYEFFQVHLSLQPSKFTSILVDRKKHKLVQVYDLKLSLTATILLRMGDGFLCALFCSTCFSFLLSIAFKRLCKDCYRKWNLLMELRIGNKCSFSIKTKNL